MPRFEHSGLWLNSLLYADDVVIIGAPDTMPRLLRAAENHSRSLGYRWNPAKCVVLNPPNAHGARPLKLYGTEIPSSNSFTYLGIPFSIKGAIDTKLLLQRNVASGLAAMPDYMQPLFALALSMVYVYAFSQSKNWSYWKKGKISVCVLPLVAIRLLLPRYSSTSPICHQ
ncbi:hypothetical protein G6F50_015495 [Rhizopus delemar]|uniref:Reverse transcriptase domain-containing protein n=1 Tax=Rhizopus delemar TaxID=936053 RepID=A0A9P7C4F2_9FUNG|nr:hypothetical protein G6F50_015495 [Rhizopus delemar]